KSEQVAASQHRTDQGEVIAMLESQLQTNDVAADEMPRKKQEYAQREDGSSNTETPSQRDQEGDDEQRWQRSPGRQQAAGRLHPVVVKGRVGRQRQQDLTEIHEQDARLRQQAFDRGVVAPGVRFP